MPTQTHPPAARGHQGTSLPKCADAAHLCPCGCGSELKLYKGRRALVCGQLWHSLPMAVRRKFLSPFELERRSAAREILEAALDARHERERKLLATVPADPLDASLEGFV